MGAKGKMRFTAPGLLFYPKSDKATIEVFCNSLDPDHTILTPIVRVAEHEINVLKGEMFTLGVYIRDGGVDEGSVQKLYPYRKGSSGKASRRRTRRPRSTR